MRRTKEWWACLTKAERIELVALERENSHCSRSGYLPDGCCECRFCGTPHLGYGLCPSCLQRRNKIVRLADLLKGCRELELDGLL